jgi:hypothetical protein
MRKYTSKFVPIPNGTVLGKWTVNAYLGWGHYDCQCKCGNILELTTGDLTKGRRPNACMNCKYPKIEAGTKFGKWTIRSHVRGSIYWCECVCGKRLKIEASTLKNGERNACNRCASGLAEGEASFNELYGTYRRNAKKSNRDFLLTKEQAKQLFLTNCYYCGVAPSLLKKPKNRIWSGFWYNGIDRIDNAKGYIVPNCLPCCAICNHMKHIMSYEDFLRHVNRIAEHRG